MNNFWGYENENVVRGRVCKDGGKWKRGRMRIVWYCKIKRGKLSRNLLAWNKTWVCETRPLNDNKFRFVPYFLTRFLHKRLKAAVYLRNFCVLVCLQKDEVYLHLVLEYIPETVYKVARHYSKSKQTIPVSFIKVSKMFRPS